MSSIYEAILKELPGTRLTPGQKRKKPTHVISVKIGNTDQYVFSAPFDAKNIRKPVLTSDIDKALPFWSEDDANAFKSKFRRIGSREYKAEPYQAAAEKN